MNDERSELLAWLTRNKLTLEKYDSDEVYILAKQNGFPVDLICEVLSYWCSDRESRCSYSTRESWYVNRELDSLNLLRDAWRDLGLYLTTGRDFYGNP